MQGAHLVCARSAERERETCAQPGEKVAGKGLEAELRVRGEVKGDSSREFFFFLIFNWYSYCRIITIENFAQTRSLLRSNLRIFDYVKYLRIRM